MVSAILAYKNINKDDFIDQYKKIKNLCINNKDINFNNAVILTLTYIVTNIEVNEDKIQYYNDLFCDYDFIIAKEDPIHMFC